MQRGRENATVGMEKGFPASQRNSPRNPPILSHIITWTVHILDSEDAACDRLRTTDLLYRVRENKIAKRVREQFKRRAKKDDKWKHGQ